MTITEMHLKNIMKVITEHVNMDVAYVTQMTVSGGIDVCGLVYIFILHSFSVSVAALPLYGNFLLLLLRRVPCSRQNIHFLTEDTE
jgi:hypothetical protein